MAGEFSCDRRFFTSRLFSESHTGFRACHSRYNADRFTIRIPSILKKIHKGVLKRYELHEKRVFGCGAKWAVSGQSPGL